MPHDLRSEACASHEMDRGAQVLAQWSRAKAAVDRRAELRARDKRLQTRQAIKSIALIGAMCVAGVLIQPNPFA
jgi:hypothetical protein